MRAPGVNGATATTHRLRSENITVTLSQKAFSLLQYPLPQHALSRLTGKFAQCDNPWVKNTLIKAFIKRFNVDMSQALEPDPTAYATFNDFFTRALKADARPVGEGILSTVYLSPRDYHRVHMPVTGTLREMIYVPGRLFSVNQATANYVPGLFARNERLVCIFDTEHGPMAMVLVGAMIVAAIETVWSGQVTPLSGYPQRMQFGQPIVLEKGAEMGRFKLGSTVVMCFANPVNFEERPLATMVSMGESLGNH